MNISKSSIVHSKVCVWYQSCAPGKYLANRGGMHLTNTWNLLVLLVIMMGLKLAQLLKMLLMIKRIAGIAVRIVNYHTLPMMRTNCEKEFGKKSSCNPLKDFALIYYL